MSKDTVKKRSNNSTAKRATSKADKADKAEQLDKAEKLKAENRKKRRAERNRLRTIKHIHKLLDQIVEGVGTEFNHHGWCNAATAFKQASIFLEPQEHKAIGDTWAPMYADETATNDGLVYVIERAKERIAGSLLEML